MSSPFIAEIRIFPYTFAPRGWAYCDGRLLSIAQNTALFSLISITYGGNGTTTFALPNLQGRAPLGTGQGPGLTPRVLGEAAGSTNETLTIQQIPSHNHSVAAANIAGTQSSPAGQYPATDARTSFEYIAGATLNTALASNAVQTAGGSQSHSNMQPFLALNFCIALEGIYPSRS
jgi:microcystin-dependent protein